ncbi:hypothetical protein J421_5905 (plasmid) [Gemmatirosa kalamazoonensis]|uniref:DUF2306 domain-containing protein n=1 Tax=Gemmatirosa kalamazoonensis TaxID=861299 RepID=W0RSZ6_9BACT|nr:hypothetical protein [Gemmatirosa kalamazoonensis]AHG93440.1 hypothetical protein J421_5905 [Gemmatirosa kalamazoonensis]
MTTDTMRVAAPAEARRTRRFYVGMTAAAMVVVFVGFAPSYYLRALTAAPPIPTIAHVHGAVFTGWLVLLLAQTSLVAAHRVDLHRRLGVAGGALAAAMLVLGVLASLDGARRNRTFGAFPDGLAFMIVPLGDIALFGGFTAAALHFRYRRETHKRLMLLGTISLTWPGIVRIPVVQRHIPLGFLLLAALLAAGPIHDRLVMGRVHRVYRWGAPLVFLSLPLRVAIGTSAWWHRVAAWMVR